MAKAVCGCFGVLVFLFFSLCNAASTDPQVATLLSFKASLHDPLGFLSNWNSPNHFCTWYGISCLNSSHVTRIELPAKNLAGNLSPFPFLLPFLKSVNLSHNAFHGQLPKEIFSCLSLRYLNLSSNNFTGTIPYGSNSRLETLDLYNNMLTGAIPPEIGLFSSLKSFDLGGNLLTGEIPISIANLQSLQLLTLAGNQLIGAIPPELGQLKSLNWIYLGYNNLSGEIPKELGYLSSLNHLDLVYNNLTGRIPQSLGNLTGLRYLFLYQNRLTGPIPPSIFNLVNLVSLDLSDNYLSGEIPQLLHKLKNLEILHLFSNNFSGKIPRGVAYLRRLRVLQLWSNQFHGEIPQNIGRLNNLTVLDLSTNNLTGMIPNSLCASRRLYKLILFSNSLEGGIPKSLGYCTSLQRIRIQNNRISGVLAPEFTRLPLVYFLDVSGNNIYGNVYRKWNMPLLEMLNLARNRFSGSLPEFIDSRHLKLDTLDMSGNQFSGNIPASYGSLAELMQLKLGQNQMSGFIPDDLSSSKKLVNLDLSGNQLSGEIPVGFTEMSVLGQLDLSENQLSGEIPANLGQTESLVQVNISYNNFHGSLPSTVAFFAIKPSAVTGNQLCGGDATSGLPPCKARARHVTWLFTSSLIVTLALLVSSIILTIFIQKQRRSQSKKVNSDQNGVWDIQFLDTKASNLITMDDILSSMKEENTLCRGNNGTLYKGKSSVKQQQFMVQELRDIPPLSLSFWDEIGEQAKLRHPNVVKLIGTFRSEKNGLIVYEFTDGRRLSDVVSEMRWEFRRKIVVGIAKALRFLHCQCTPSVLLVNCCLENVIVDGKGEPRVLPRLPGSYAKYFLSSDYAAPEIKKMKAETTKSDIYAYGILLIQILSGKDTVDSALSVHENVVNWAHYCYSECHLDTWIDVALRGQSSNSNKEMVDIMNLALHCTATDPMARPCSNTVTKTLESILRTTSCISL